MEIQIRFRGVDRSPALVQFATQRIEHYLGRFGPRVRRVVLRITDVNGPRGGEDKRCQLSVTAPGVGAVVLVETQADAYAAVELALYRVRRALAQGARPEGGRSLRALPDRLRLVPEGG